MAHSLAVRATSVPCGGLVLSASSRRADLRRSTQAAWVGINPEPPLGLPGELGRGLPPIGWFLS